MLFKNYIEKARSTAMYPNLGNNIYYPTLGLCGECSEVIEKLTDIESSDVEVIKELSDVIWYVVNAAIEFGVDLSNTFNDIDDTVCMYSDDDVDDAAFSIIVQSGAIAEIAKKVMRDSDGVVPPDKFEKVKRCLIEILLDIVIISSGCGVTVFDVMEVNIEKLFSRKRRGVITGDGDNR